MVDIRLREKGGTFYVFSTVNDDVVFAVETISFFSKFRETLSIAFVYVYRLFRDHRMTPFAQYT